MRASAERIGPSGLAEDTLSNHKHGLTRSVLANWMGYVLVLLSGFILPRLIDSHRGQVSLGLWDLGFSLLVYMKLLSLGVGSAVNRYVARHRASSDWQSLNATINSCLLILSVSAVLAMGLAGVFCHLLPRLLPDTTPDAISIGRNIVLLLAASAALKLVFGVVNGVITGYERFDVLNVIRGIRDALLLMSMIVLLIAGKGIVALAIAILCGELAASIAKWFAARRLCPQMRLSPRLVRMRVIGEMIGFGGKTMLKGLGRAILYQTNGILVAFFLGPASLAVYARQRVLVMHGVRFLNKYANVLVPASGVLDARSNRAGLQELLLRSSRYGFFIALPIVVVLLLMGGPLLELWMGPDYAAPLVLAILAAGHVLSLPQQGAYSILMGMGRHGLPSLVELGAALCSVLIGVIVLGPLDWGMWGAAIAIALPVTISAGIVLPVYACRLLGLRLRHYAKLTVPGPVAAVIPFALCLLLARWLWADEPLQALGYGMGIGGSVLAAIYWMWVVPDHLRGTIRRFLRLNRKAELVPATRRRQRTSELCNEAVAKKPSICFLAHHAYGELAGKDNGHIGGIEHQQAIMAHWLAKRGYTVSMVTWDEGQPDGQELAGVRIYKICRLEDGVRGLRFLHPRWTGLHAALGRANADIYYYNCGDMGLGQLAVWCRWHGRKCVYSVASDPDCDPLLPQLKPLRERVLYRYGLRRADRVITQTESQSDMLRRGFGLDTEFIPMPCEQTGGHALSPGEPLASRPVRVLWIGRMSEEKRLEWVFEVANHLPELAFDVVGGSNRESPYAASLLDRASRIPNVVLHGRVPRQEMDNYYRRAAVLFCTSIFEGFPNTFLEAWSHGVPVVSTVDPDQLIVRCRLGGVGRGISALVTEIRRVLSSPEAWRQISANSREYYIENHAMETVMPRFERVFQDLLHPRTPHEPAPR